MTNHPGDSQHRYKHMPKKPKPPKCRACGLIASRDDLVRVGGSRYHPNCAANRRSKL